MMQIDEEEGEEEREDDENWSAILWNLSLYKLS